MRLTLKLLGIGLFFLFFVKGAPTSAMEKLNFDQTVSGRLTRLVETMAGPEQEIARADLNEDGLDEYITRNASCRHQGAECLHHILAEKGAGLAELGLIKARHLLLGTEKRHGIRSILAFKDPLNDYDYDVYVWEPGRSQYIVLE